jgi:hypothetical protein
MAAVSLLVTAILAGEFCGRVVHASAVTGNYQPAWATMQPMAEHMDWVRRCVVVQSAMLTCRLSRVTCCGPRCQHSTNRYWRTLWRWRRDHKASTVAAQTVLRLTGLNRLLLTSVMPEPRLLAMLIPVSSAAWHHQCPAGLLPELGCSLSLNRSQLQRADG